MQAALVEYRRRASMGSDTFASRVRATKTKIERFEAAPPPEKVRDHQVTMRLGGDRTGTRVIICEQLELHGLTDPVRRRGRATASGSPCSAPTAPARATSSACSPASPSATRARGGSAPASCPATSARPTTTPSCAASTCSTSCIKRGVERGKAMAALRRYGIHGCAQQPFETLSGGQQARLQILLLELAGSTLLLLDEPTDNLDLASAEALEEALEQLRRHRRRRHPRPLVPPRLRPLPRVRPRRHGHRAPRARLRLTPCQAAADADAGSRPPPPRGPHTLAAATRRSFDQLDADAAKAAADRRLPRSTVDALKAAHAFRMPMPAAWGGPELPDRRHAAGARGAHLRRRRRRAGAP